MTGSTPPRLARWLLSATLPRALADDVVANLDDLHAARVFRDGRWRAAVWYWRQAVWFPLRLRIDDDLPVANLSSTRSTFMRSLLQDLSYAARLYRTRPGFTAVAVASLAIAIGFNTAIFSVVDSVLLRPAPLRDFERLVMVWETDRNTSTTREPASVPDFVDYRARARTFRSLGALIAEEVNLTRPGTEPARLAGLLVTHDLLPLLGVAPLAGRALTADDERLGNPVIIISESLWERFFNRDPAAIGQALALDEQDFTIVGVVADATDFGVLQVLSAAAYSRSFADRGTRIRVDVWAPLQPDPNSLPRSTHPAFMIGRLATGASIAAAQDEMTRLAADLEAAYPRDNAGRGINVEPLSEIVFGPVRPAFLALLGAVGLVLAVACVNVANLLLAQGEIRRREVAIRAALGAGRARLARQFFAETMALTLLSGVIGVGLAYLALGWLLSLAPADVPRLASATIDLRALGVALGAAAIVGLVFGVVPTLQAGRAAPRAALAAGADRSMTGGRAGSRARAMLVVAELALAVMLVIGAGLLIRSFWRLQGVDPGFETRGIVKAEYQLPATRYPVNFAVWPDFKEQHVFTRALLEQAAQLPGVSSAAIAGNHPMDPGFTNSFAVVGREAEARDWPEISIRRVTAGYFETVGLRLVEGRLFAESDTTTAAPVVVINEAARDRFFPDGPAIGHELSFWGTARRIVGIVGNERFQGLTTAVPIAAYAPLSQAPSTTGAGVLLVRAEGGVASALASLPRLVREIDPQLAVFGVEPLDDTRSRLAAERQFTLSVVGLFALMALGLSALGVHGVLSYSVAQRTREIGIRMALGAKPGRLRRHIVTQGLMLSGVGLAIGLAGALALSRLFGSLLYGITPTDPVTFAAVAGLLLAVAAGASYVPARAATRIDPTVALRADP
jgi:predicted permease